MEFDKLDFNDKSDYVKELNLLVILVLSYLIKMEFIHNYPPLTQFSSFVEPHILFDLTTHC